MRLLLRKWGMSYWLVGNELWVISVGGRWLRSVIPLEAMLEGGYDDL